MNKNREISSLKEKSDPFSIIRAQSIYSAARLKNDLKIYESQVSSETIGYFSTAAEKLEQRLVALFAD